MRISLMSHWKIIQGNRYATVANIGLQHLSEIMDFFFSVPLYMDVFAPSG